MLKVDTSRDVKSTTASTQVDDTISYIIYKIKHFKKIRVIG